LGDDGGSGDYTCQVKHSADEGHQIAQVTTTTRAVVSELRAAISNVEIVVEDEPPNGQPLLGLYRGIPLPRRTST
jgi:predicted Zn-dependent protease with MMP-like domain